MSVIKLRPWTRPLGVLSLTLFFVLSTLQCAVAQQTRTWVDSSGQFKIEATFEDLSDENVLLKLTDGQLKQIPLSMLSAADQDYVKELTAPTGPAPDQEAEEKEKVVDPEMLNPDRPPATASPPVASATKISTPVPAGARSPEQSSVSVRPAETGQPETAPPRVANASPLPDSFATPTLSSLRPDPVVHISQRIGDLKINEITPPPVVNGLQANPKYLIPVERADLLLLPKEFQGAAALLFDEARNPRAAIRGLEYLKVHWPRNRQPTLIKLVINCASSDYKYNRESALEILADRDSDQSFPYIFARVDDTSFTIRSTAYEMLRKIGDQRAIEPVAKRFDTDDVDRIASLLRFFGSASEPAVLPYLTHQDPDIRLRASNLIGKIGTPKSLPALQEMAAREQTMILQAQTRSAINKIKRRNNLN